MVRLTLVVAGLALLAGCDRPPASAYVPVASGAAGQAQIDVGRTAAGDECRLSRVGNGGDVWCGDWQTPSVRVREARAATALAAAEEQRAGANGQLDCAAPRATTALGGEPAAIMDCRRRAGGWPAFGLGVAAGGRVWQAEGILPALPAAERAIGVLSGRETAGAATPLPSGALDLMASRLAREAFATGDIGRYESLMQIGRDANQAERFVAAETAYRAALALQERALGGNAPGSFSPLLLLALQLSNQGRHPEAEALFARAAVLAPRAPDPLAPAMLAHYRALHEANRGRTDAALAGLTQGGQLYARLLPPELRGAAAPPRGLAALAYDPLTARALVGLIETRRNSAAILRAANRPAEAEAAAAEATRLAAGAPGIGGADLIEARLQRTGGAVAASAGQGASAERSFGRSASRFARGVPRSRPYAETLLLQAAQRELDGAAPLCRQALEVLRSLREGTTAERVAPCVDAFATLAEGRPEQAQSLLGEAFETAQLAQGNVTTTQIAAAAARLAASARNPAVGEALRRRDDTGRAVTALYRERDAAVAAGGDRTALAAMDARIAAAEATAADADAAVQTAAPGFAQLVQSVVSAGDAMAALQPGEALAMSTLPPAGRGWTFVLLDGRIAVGRVQQDGAAVSALVQKIRASVESGAPDKPFEAAAAHDLYRALFGSVAAALAPARSLVVVPEGRLLSMPYSMLVTAPPPQPRSHEGASFLLTRLPVAYVPAPASLVELRRTGRSQAPNPWFGFGAPRPINAAFAARSFPAAPNCGRLLAGLAALPAAAVELQAAAQVTGAGPGTRDTGAAFTVDAVRQVNLRDYRVVHFATHGVLPSELACLTEPTIIASTGPTGPNADAALLTSGTVLNLDLDADLVLLSACNSGGGAAAGESLSTLARAFFFAGARALLVTHWYVNDSAAARVGIFTLRYMREGDSPALALQKAQIGVTQLRGGGHPAFWAPFALIGPGPGAPAPPRSAAGPAGAG